MGANAQPLARAGDEPHRLVSDDLYPLVEAMARGDEQALEALYDRTSSRVMGMTLRILGERASAEEAVLDVFSQAWRQASRYDPARGHVLAWLLNWPAAARSICSARARAPPRGRPRSSRWKLC
jgi:RNA polymerase sigma-70 factor (ECF subfamily)